MKDEVDDASAGSGRAMETATDQTDRTGAKAPRLSDEQREWLNRVFIPNFRAELMRTLELKGLLRKNGMAKTRIASMQQDAKSGGDGAGDASLSNDERGGMNEERGVSAVGGLPEAAGDVDKPAGTPPASDRGEAKAGAFTSGEGPALDEALQAAKAAAERAEERASEFEAENKRLRGALAETRVEQELVWAAAQRHAISAAQVARLMKDQVRLDRDLEPVVVDGNGDRVVDAHGRAMTVADAVRTFLDENPHLVRPTGELTGGGSGGTDATAMARRVTAMTGGDLIEEALREGA
jgi:hypothetical protein